MIEVRSYRRAFDVERRIYSIDTLRLNPGGVPVRGLAYYLALAAVLVVAARLPLAGLALRALPWYARKLLLPALLAGALSVLRIDGHTFHVAARALLRFWIEPRRLSRLQRCPPASVWRPEPLLWLPDGSDARMRRLRYTGPGAVLVAREHELRERRADGSRLAVLPRRAQQPLADASVIVLARGARLRVLPAQPAAERA
jgi:hypothetical protein